MGVNTDWYVRVQKVYEKIILIAAITSEEAKEKAKRHEGVLEVMDVKHCSEVDDKLDVI